MAALWNALTDAQQGFACIAILATAALVVQSFLFQFGIGLGGRVKPRRPSQKNGGDEFSFDLGKGISGWLLDACKALVPFFVVLGWLGLILLLAMDDNPMAVVWAFLAGLVALIFMTALFRYVRKVQQEITAEEETIRQDIKNDTESEKASGDR